MDWIVAKSGNFNCTETWEAIRSRQPLLIGEGWSGIHLLSQGIHYLLDGLALRN